MYVVPQDGKPYYYAPPLKTVTFKIEQDLLEEIDILVETCHTTRSEFIRRALKSYAKFVQQNGCWRGVIKTSKMKVYW